LFGWPWLVLVLLALLLGGVAVLALLSALSRRPANLGVKDGKLAPCPGSPNCVCTQAADEAHRIEPLRFDGDAAEAWARLKRVLAAQPRCRVAAEEAAYLHAEFTSLIFRFVDDVEFVLDAERGAIHFRSASRAGRSDLGVNRARMEAIRKAFAGSSGVPA
jgi:uncharacterized protein (DUF1499 family)